MANKPLNSGKPWNPIDLAKLRILARQDTPTRIAALKLGRSPEAVYNKAHDEGISLKPADQSPHNTVT